MTPPPQIRIREIVQTIERAVAVSDPEKNSDSFAWGNPDLAVTAIAVTYMATRTVLDRARELRANFIITHEPTFYLDLEQTAWLRCDPVFLEKRQFLERHKMVIWKFHDGWHRRHPDGILEGMVRKLGWTMPEDLARPNLCRVNSLTLRELALHCRKALNIGPVRVVGDPAMPCSSIGFLPGACGGRKQMEVLCLQGADVIVCGESPEWETCEYIRDANHAGSSKGLVVLGHANSEEAGMEYCAEWLRTLLPASVPVFYFPAGDPFQTI